MYIYMCVYICTCSKEKNRAFLKPTATSRPFAQPDGKNQATPTPQDGGYGIWLFYLFGDCRHPVRPRSFILLAFWSSLWTGALTNHGHKMGQNGVEWVKMRRWVAKARGGPSMRGSRVKGFLMVMRATKHVPIDCTAVGQPTNDWRGYAQNRTDEFVLRWPHKNI